MSDTERARDDPSIPAFWRVDSSPFSRPGDPSQPARVVLRQVDDKNFDLVEPLVYTPPADVPGAPSTPLEVRERWLRSRTCENRGIRPSGRKRHPDPQSRSAGLRTPSPPRLSTCV